MIADDGEQDPTQQFDSSIQVPDRQYTKRRRHKAINDARERVSNVVLEIEKLRLSNQMHEWEARRATRRAVETFVREVLWLLQNHPDGQAYLTQEALGVMTLPKPSGATTGRFARDTGAPSDFPHVHFKGLQSLLEAPEKIEGVWQATTESHFSGTDTATQRVEQFVPLEISMRAYELVVEFLGKADFGIDFDDDRPLVKATPEPDADTRAGVFPFKESTLYEANKKLTVSGDNDQLIVISASSHTPVSGTGKTTLATTLAKALDSSPDGYDAEEKATFSIQDLTYNMLDDVAEGSAIIFDEAQGTPSGTGLNARRGMKTESIDAVNGLLANRDKNLTVIMIGQQLNMLDTNLYGKIDAWILIRKGVEERNGPLATHHSIYTNDYDLGNPDPKTPAEEDVTWEALPDDDADYAVMEKMKQEAKKRQSQEEEEDQDLPDDVQSEIAQEYRDLGKSLKWIEDEVDAVTYSREWIRLNTETPEKEVTADD